MCGPISSSLYKGHNDMGICAPAIQSRRVVAIKDAGGKFRICLMRSQGRTENVFLLPVEIYGITGVTGPGKARQCLQPVVESFRAQRVLSQRMLLFICISYISYNFQYTITLSGDYFFVCFFNSIYLWVFRLPFL